MAGGTHIIRMRKRHAQMQFLLKEFTKPVINVDGMGDMEYEEDGYCPTGITFALINSGAEDRMAGDRISPKQFSTFMMHIQSYFPKSLRVTKGYKDIWAYHTFNRNIGEETQKLVDECIEWYHDMRSQTLNILSFNYFTQGKIQFIEILKRRWKNKYSEKVEQAVDADVKTDNKIIFTALETDIVSAMKGVFDTKNLVVDRLYKGYRWNGGEIELYEDGKYSGDMQLMKASPYRGDEHPSLTSSKDWWAIGYHVGVVGRSRSSYNTNGFHLYKYTLKDKTAKVRVEATDRFGQVYATSTITADYDYSLVAPK